MIQFLMILLCLFVGFGCASSQARYLKKHPQLSAEQAQAVRGKTVTHGLSKEDVRASLGKPQKTFGYRKGGKLTELWVYSEFEWHPYQNVLFQEGKVTAWNLPANVKRELDESAPDELLVVLERAASTNSSEASPPTL